MAKEKTSFQRWYERNKDSINKKRRIKYKADSEYREQAKRSTSAAYRAKPFVSKAGASKVKMVQGKSVTTCSMSEAASSIGRSMPTIRLWEARGWIPAPTVDAGKRFYTVNQVSLLSELAGTLDSLRTHNLAEREKVLAKVVSSIKARWFLI